MAASDQFLSALHEWTGVFMRNSMRHFLHFSKERGVSMPQIGALFQIRRKGVCSVSEISGELEITSAAASQMLESLVMEGLVRRSEDPNDRRAKQIVLTEKGRKTLQESIHSRQGWLTQLINQLTEQEQVQIASALKILTERASRLEQKNNAGG
jgi:DNA-binding MarR family transcriptional regulator